MGQSLQPITTTFNVSSAGDYDLIDLTGYFNITASGTVNITRSRINGPAAGFSSGPTGLVHGMGPNVSDINLYDCDLWCQHPSEWVEALRSHHIHAERCHIKWTVDGCQVFNTNSGQIGVTDVALKGCHIHALSFWYPDSFHANGTHNDCIQIQGSNNAVVTVGNNFEGFYNADGATTDAGFSLGTSLAASSGNKRANLTANSCLQMGIEQAPNCSIDSDGDWWHGGTFGMLNCPNNVPNYGNVRNGWWGTDANQGTSWQLNANGLTALGRGTQSNNKLEGTNTLINVR